MHGYGSAEFLRTLHDCVAQLRGRPVTDRGTRHELRLMTKGDPAARPRGALLMAEHS
ncbi:MAG: hypothetical protein L0I24_25775 [Pseudonocardia sp.]|nr:hypothetical protein [Pseudonocardia sp.]